MKRLVLCVWLLTTASVAGAPAPFPKAERGVDLRPFQGEWEWGMVYVFEKSGQLRRFYDKLRAAVIGNRIRFYDNGTHSAELDMTFCLNPMKGSAAGDLSDVTSSQIRRGIYATNGEVFVILTTDHGNSRPSSFAKQRGGGVFIKLRRKSPIAVE